jgi:hypothetical protein
MYLSIGMSDLALVVHTELHQLHSTGQVSVVFMDRTETPICGGFTEPISDLLG